MSNHPNHDLARRFIREVEDAVISHANAPAVAILEFLRTRRERILFQQRSTRAIRFCIVPGSRANSFFASRASSTLQFTRESADLSGHRGAGCVLELAAPPAQAYRRGHRQVR